jgi:hypothetical protein
LKTTKARTATLVICVALLALLLGSLSTGLVAPLSSALHGLPSLHPSTKAQQTVTIEIGRILVNTSLLASTSLLLFPSNSSLEEGAPARTVVIPIPNATVKIQRDALGSFPLQFETNSSGEVGSELVAGNYTLTISTPSFSTSAQVRVYQSLTTEADVLVSRLADQAIFSDLSDEDSSGSVAPWQSINLAVLASSAPTETSAGFLDLYYGTASTGIVLSQITEVPVTVTASQVSGSGDSSLVWFTLRPESFLPVQGLVDLTLVTYSATTRTFVHG